VAEQEGGRACRFWNKSRRAGLPETENIVEDEEVIRPISKRFFYEFP